MGAGETEDTDRSRRHWSRHAGLPARLAGNLLCPGGAAQATGWTLCVHSALHTTTHTAPPVG